MAVYTPLLPQQLIAYLAHFDLGELQSFEGVYAGVTNSNYKLTTSTGSYFLTLIETLTAEQLPFFLDLTEFLAEAGIPVAKVHHSRNGERVLMLADKPAILVDCLQGETVEQPSIAQVAACGRQLAQLHLATASLSLQQANTRGLAWHLQTAERCREHLSPSQVRLIDASLGLLKNNHFDKLESGIIHADLFRDNVLFNKDKLSGVVDFYYAYHGPYVLDLAIAYNDWCFSADGCLHQHKSDVFLEAYQSIRPLSELEHQYWSECLQLAALRFWLSRLYDAHFPSEGAHVAIKLPEYFEYLLRYHSEQ